MTAPRRGFLKALAAAPLAPAALAGQAPPPPGASTPPPGPAGVAEALAEVARREFGAHLDASELPALRKEIESGLESAARLRAAARLRNADEPVTRFEALPPGAPRGVRR